MSVNYDKIIVCDVECYKNYLLIMFKKITTGETICFEKFNDADLNIDAVINIMQCYTVVTFNGNNYDTVVIDAAIVGLNNAAIHKISSRIIEENLQPWEIRREANLKELRFNHIDLIQIPQQTGSLKVFGGRLHGAKLKDLPIPPSAVIEKNNLNEMRTYCANDLDLTDLLFRHLHAELDLRVSMSEQYKIDLRSKSDAQIAEIVINDEIKKRRGRLPDRPDIKVGTEFYYDAPANLEFETDTLKTLLKEYKTQPFVIDKDYKVEFNFAMSDSDKIKTGKNKGKFPTTKRKLKLKIGNTIYTAGIGGVHSCEKSIMYTNENVILRDYDVSSYYSHVILNHKLYPKHIGRLFLKIYGAIVKRRLKAKRANEKIISASLKLTVNGLFGKMGSKWSRLFAPDLLMQVTITGQLSLLMLIESLEKNNISVISANTDGIVVKMDKNNSTLANGIVKQWGEKMSYKMESTDYKYINMRDVNNYIAIKTNGDVKAIGAYANQSDHYNNLRINPNNDICKIAAIEFLKNDTSIEHTVHACKDIRMFLTLRKVTGGAIKNGQLLGKVIRWYHGKNESGDTIKYAISGNKVPKSEGAVPLMDLPDAFPTDVDHAWYIASTKKMLTAAGCHII